MYGLNQNTTIMSQQSQHSGSPRLSIGLPVYNGENYLAKALDSILDQSFEDFELIISDNASTDRTVEICREYAARDSRIRLYTNVSNIGAAKNFNILVDLARAPYFKWMAHDDLHGKDFLKKCVEVLDSNPEVVLCYSKGVNISPDNEERAELDFKLRVDDNSPHIRFRDWVHSLHVCIAVFGVIRTDILKKTALIGAYTASDRNLLAELSLYGPFRKLPETLFFRREHELQSTQAYPDDKDRLEWFDPKAARKFHLPTFKRAVEYLKAVTRAPLGLAEKKRCYDQVLSLAFRSSARKRIFTDLVKVSAFKR